MIYPKTVPVLPLLWKLNILKIIFLQEKRIITQLHNRLSLFTHQRAETMQSQIFQLSSTAGFTSPWSRKLEQKVKQKIPFCKAEWLFLASQSWLNAQKNNKASVLFQRLHSFVQHTRFLPNSWRSGCLQLVKTSITLNWQVQVIDFYETDLVE